MAALSFTPLALSIVIPTKTLALPRKCTLNMQVPRCSPIKATPVAHDNSSSTVDYSSNASVFPAEACETIGGEACDVEMYPEVKLKPEAQSTKAKTASEQTDREYLEYNSPKTVFLGEACDDLGGEFCEPEYQTGVY
ncbi:light-regulated protein-like [Durio zibethinus]|uniref:Light-regulated protein-like n=1 Tax=Durio zibethinus TaxID=66656 RepID=A0A6P5YC62_DURZI|nr:light-regulated protein-like [Durio zibethinus]XP_022737904.1 light-regulated protein-like [Durio zibethinus]